MGTLNNIIRDVAPIIRSFYYTHYVRFIFIVSDCGPDVLYGKVIAKGEYLER